MKSIYKFGLMITIVLSISFNSSIAQIKNLKTKTVKVYGNCSMCKKNIETAAYQKRISSAVWDKENKTAVLNFDSTKTTEDAILKNIALAGYDNQNFIAPDNAFNKLDECCKYERIQKKMKSFEIYSEADSTKNGIYNQPVMTESKKEVTQLKTIFENYFAIKDALVKTDGNTATSKAKELFTAINSVKMDKLTTEEHTVWMKVMKNLSFDAEHIANTKNVSLQRDHFITLSKNIYELIKVSKSETPTYYLFCPMANGGKGANWLSKENVVKNPFYGSQMLTCGKVVETIK